MLKRTLMLAAVVTALCGSYSLRAEKRLMFSKNDAQKLLNLIGSDFWSRIEFLRNFQETSESAQPEMEILIQDLDDTHSETESNRDLIVALMPRLSEKGELTKGFSSEEIEQLRLLRDLLNRLEYLETEINKALSGENVSTRSTNAPGRRIGLYASQA